MNRRGATMSLWAVPVALALLTAAGLVSALLGDDWWDMLSWVLLGVPVAVCVWFGGVRRSVRT